MAAGRDLPGRPAGCALICLALYLPAVAHAAPPEDEIRIAGYVQCDGRGAEGDHPLLDGFLVRRARLASNGTLNGIFAFKVETELARSTETLQEGWAEFAPSGAVRLRAGLFKVPYGYEKLVSSRYDDFTESSLPGVNFHSFIDTGLMLHGEIASGRFGYAVSLLNGEGRFQPNRNEYLQYGGRLVGRPFAGPAGGPGDLHLGLSAHREGAGTPAFARQVTALGTTILRFADSLSFDGARTRWGAEAAFARGPFRWAAEYYELRQEGLQRDDVRGAARQNGGYASLTWLVTGEPKEAGRAVRPERPWRRTGGGIGAWELGLRYDWLETGEDVLDSGLATGTPKTQGITGGLHLWPTQNARLLLDVYHHWFAGVVVQEGVPLESETGVIARMQLAFQATVLER